MNIRSSAELKYDCRRLNNLIHSHRLRSFLPEILEVNGFEEQPYTMLGSKGINAKLKDSKKTLFVTGPCMVASKDIKNVLVVAERKLKNEISDKEYFKSLQEILDRQPSLQNTISIGACINNLSKADRDILCIMETYEIALMLAHNDVKLFEKYKESLIAMANETAKRIEKIIEKLRKDRKIKSKIIFFYTHKDREKALTDDIVNYLDQKNIRPREGSYFFPTYWKNTFKTRIELTYTKMFTDSIKSFFKTKYDTVVICENYKHLFQIFDGTFILPLEYFGINSGHDWIGIIPIPSPTNEREMDVVQPLFLGKMLINSQLENIGPSVNRFSLGSYLLGLDSSKDLKKKHDNTLENIFASRLSEVQKKRFLQETKDIILDKINKIC